MRPRIAPRRYASTVRLVARPGSLRRRFKARRNSASTVTVKRTVSSPAGSVMAQPEGVPGEVHTRPRHTARPIREDVARPTLAEGVAGVAEGPVDRRLFADGTAAARAGLQEAGGD